MYVRVTRPEEGIGQIQLHRPDVLNALNLQLMEELVSEGLVGHEEAVFDGLRLMTNPLALFARKAPGVACLWGINR